MTISQITLTDFRNYRDSTFDVGPGFVILTGPNGSGKTNVLEAVSLLAPGRGLRQVAISDMARRDGPGQFAISAMLADGNRIGTGTAPGQGDRRQVRINGAAAAVNSLSERLSILWLTPAMDRLFVEGAGARRRFLDRLTLALEPSHASHASRYEAAMRARNKLLAEPGGSDEAWLTALESGMAEHGEALAAARQRTVAALSTAEADRLEDDFPQAALALEGWAGEDLATTLRQNRGRDVAAGRANEGPHRQDLIVVNLAKEEPAALGSTGEQKALLLGLILAHADLVTARRGVPPILLLDEVAAHLDPARRAALYERLDGRGQVWMTGTEEQLFDTVGTDATRIALTRS